MENNTLLKFFKEHFFETFSMVEKIIEICPDELWNSKKSGFVFWQLLIHTLAPMHGWLREEELGYVSFNEINGGKIYAFLEKDPEIILTKEDLKKCCNETKEVVENWFSGKDDEWLKLPYKIHNEWTNLYATLGQIEHMMYHIGYCDGIFKEHGMKEVVWN
ncbi:hypothetical protein [Leadbettera azotonutricia]|uniref:DinB-like domain-containing protein n=1 Tax=Leadbettera azotonutricia (strain ATCC BAA-888 / DSM 13862 / ZAS-9) TaxID=545695 RepID=F5Y9N8_LEAAZ|nr:hypothetical protein [Leadbettera azotonutricia]AEF83305.1 hypothetical protein TREAZ_0792 [Leadbettera azotonutricia ZAS-9]